MARRLNMAALCGIAAAILQGCVAAAIPLVAGGAIVRTGTDGRDATVTVESDAEAGADLLAPNLEPAPLSEATIASNPPPPGIKKVIAGEAPPPDSVPTIAPTAAVAQLMEYARNAKVGATGQSGVEATGTLSAILADPSALDGERRECQGTMPMILIDLDPAGRVFAAGDAITAPAGLAAGLAELREEGISIAWISGASAAYAPDIRIALKATDLDPEAKDTLLLMRYPGDRKQTRREDLAKSSCLLAIAGDEREDFDELYDYLVNPEAALALELLIGDGWFLFSDTPDDEQSDTQTSSEEDAQ